MILLEDNLSGWASKLYELLTPRYNLFVLDYHVGLFLSSEERDEVLCSCKVIMQLIHKISLFMYVKNLEMSMT